MHRLVIELMVFPFVLHIIGVIEFVQVESFLFRTSFTGVPIFYIRSAGEAYVLVGPIFHYV
jgi:hypothetical protein